MKKTVLALIIILAVIMAAACTATPAAPEAPATAPAPTQETLPSPDISPPEEQAPEMTASSGGIAGGMIDPKYGMHGEMVSGVPVVSLPVMIQNAPEGTACFALYMNDPDAEGWIHWMAANIKESVIPEDYSRNAPDSVVQGVNDFGTVGYGGPTPPRDHTYQIIIYALDAPLDLQNGFTAGDLDNALQGHILADYTFKGVYKK